MFMGAFRDFYEDQRFVEMILNEFNGPVLPPVAMPQKSWSAKKPEILQMWQGLRPDTPIVITPMHKDPMGAGTKSYGEDGIRITGSWQFIQSILGRLKELMSYENPQNKLRLVLRSVDKSKTPNRTSYVFYLNLEKRGTGRAGRPSTNAIQPIG